jgi:hypothetical protein
MHFIKKALLGSAVTTISAMATSQPAAAVTITVSSWNTPSLRERLFIGRHTRRTFKQVRSRLLMPASPFLLGVWIFFS